MPEEPRIQPVDDRPQYVPPRVMSVADSHPGMGACVGPGSGDSGDCTPTGNTAGTGCYDGNSPALGCKTGIGFDKKK